MRLAKMIAGRGLASRREAEDWIREGRVQVNGAVVTDPATGVEEQDHVRLDGKALPGEPPKVYLLMNKPRGVLTSRVDAEGRQTVFDVLGKQVVRVEPVGRLDFDTEGALLFTNDGELAFKLSHPSGMVPKRYRAKVWRTPTDKTLERLRRGVQLEDGRTAPAKVRVLEATEAGNCWLEITITEGRNRLVKRMLQAVNHPVSKLRRESFATLSVRDLERGKVRPLTAEELRRVKALADGKKPKAPTKQAYGKGHARPKPKAVRGRKKTRDSRTKGVR